MDRRGRNEANRKRNYFRVDAHGKKMCRKLTGFFQHQHYRINKFLLTINGQWPYTEKRKKNFLMFVTFAIFFTGMPAQVCTAKEALNKLVTEKQSRVQMIVVHRTDWLKVLPTLGPLFVHIGCMIKICNSLYHENKMRGLLERMYDDWHAPMGPEKKVLKQFADDGRLFTMIYAGVLYCSMTTYLIVSTLPRFLLVNGWANITTSTVFPIPIYFTPYDEEYFVYIETYLLIVIVIVLSISIAVDSMFVVYIQHGCGIFAAVSYRLEHLVDHEDLEIDFDPPPMADKIFWIVVDCIKKHNEAIEYADRLEAAFHWSFFLLVWMNMLSLSFTGLQVVWGASTDSADEAFRQAVFGSSQLLHLLFINLFSQRLTNHSLDVYASIIQSKWYLCSRRTRILLQFMLTRSAIPWELKAGKMVTMSVATFSVFVRTSLSYLTILGSVE